MTMTKAEKLIALYKAKTVPELGRREGYDNGARVVTEQGKRRVVVNTYPGSWARYTAKVEKRSNYYGWDPNDESLMEHTCSFQSRWESQAIRRAVRDMQRHERFSARMKAMSHSPGSKKRV